MTLERNKKKDSVVDVLFITFDYHFTNKPKKSVAVATLESYLKNKMKLINIDVFSFNMNESDSIYFSQMQQLTEQLSSEYDYICVGMYAWSMSYMNNLLILIEDASSFAKIICGGYEVNSMNINRLQISYSQVDHFIIGFAEEALYKLINNEIQSKVVSIDVNNNDIPKIYSNHIIDVKKGSTVSLETKRGCPYNCSFCSYKGNDHRKITKHNLDKIKVELKYLDQVGVEKVNIIDPIFTLKNYKSLLMYLIEINFKPTLSIQAKFEVLNNEMIRDKMLIDMLSKLNVVLEFGLQSINGKTLRSIERVNDLSVVQTIIHKLNDLNIKYEVSVIRGLPGETLDSFIDLLNFLDEISCKNYIVYQLTLLSNTKLCNQVDEFGLQYVTVNGLDFVISSNSYTYKDYLKMIALEKRNNNQDK